MQTSSLFVLILALALISYYTGLKRAQQSRRDTRLLALPTHYGYMTAMLSGIPALVLLLAWSIFEPAYLDRQIELNLPASVLDGPADHLDLVINSVHLQIAGTGIADNPLLQDAADAYIESRQKSRQLVSGLILLLGLSGIVFAMSRYLTGLHARRRIESVVRLLLMACSGVAIFTTIGIVLSVLFEALRFFESVSIIDFMFGTSWSPQTAIRDDQVGSSGSFGAVPLFLGTILISLIAMTIAVPVGLMTAIYLAEYASRSFRSIAKPLLEVLAGIPTVVYGFFAALTVAPFIRNMGESIGLSVAS